MVGFAMPNARFSGDRSESAAMKSWALGVQTVEKQMGAQPQYAQPLISSGLHILHARRSQTGGVGISNGSYFIDDFVIQHFLLQEVLPGCR
jgi:hypothetical protein